MPCSALGIVVLAFRLLAVQASSPCPAMSGASRVPRLLVFDLDACLWSPEMCGQASARKARARSAL
jgi:hypothetical protein